MKTRIFISLAKANTYTKGDRVVDRAGKNEWYVGTVTRFMLGI